jgi:hypothetical protein
MSGWLEIMVTNATLGRPGHSPWGKADPVLSGFNPR